MIWFRFLLHRNPTDKAHWFVMSPFCRPILDDPEIVNTLPPIPLAKIPLVENIPATAANVIPLMERTNQCSLSVLLLALGARKQETNYALLTNYER